MENITFDAPEPSDLIETDRAHSTTDHSYVPYTDGQREVLYDSMRAYWDTLTSNQRDFAYNAADAYRMSPVDWLVNQAAAGLEWEVDTTLDDVEEFFSILSEDQLNYLYMISERTDRIRDTAVMEYLMDRADNGLEWREVPEVLDMSLCHADFTYEYPFAHGNMFEAMSLYPAVVALD